MSFIILMNHTLTEDQKSDALQTFQTTNFIVPPSDIARIWSNIPADAKALDPILAPIRRWLETVGKAHDIILIQGDFGAVFDMVLFAFDKHLVPVYATTERTAVENINDDGSVEITRIFRHRMFRKYSPIRVTDQV